MRRLTDNQQRKVASNNWRDLVWLAGFMDGEGCFRGHQGYGGKRLTPEIIISNTHAPTKDKVHEILQAHGVGHYIWCEQRIGKQKNQDLWQIRIVGLMRVRTFLRKIAPHLITKREQAQVLYEFCSARLKTPQHHPYTDEEREMIAKLSNLKRPLRSTTTRETPQGDGIV